MKPWILIDSTPIAGGGMLHLFQHVRDFAIRIDHTGGIGHAELMNSMSHGSEEALARLAWERLGARSGTHVLVGGLGMGFTVSAALRGLPADGRITVAELVPAVVAWNRGPLSHLAGHPLADPRVAVHVGDVADLLRGQEPAYDQILLDVDNGPQGLTTKANHQLYGHAGLARLFRVLHPGGVLAVWSAGGDESFTRRLIQAGFQAECVRTPANGRRGHRHVIWVAIRPTPPLSAPVRGPATQRR